MTAQFKLASTQGKNFENKDTTLRSNISNSLAFYFSYFSIYLDCIIHNSLIYKGLLAMEIELYNLFISSI